MALQLANRAGALRRLHLGDIPSRVFTVQNQLRRLCLSSQPRLTPPKAGVLSATISQNATFATKATKPKKPKTTTKATKKPKTTKKSHELSEKQKEAKVAREQREIKKKLKETALTTPKKLPSTSYQLAIQSVMGEARAATGTTQIEAFQKAVQLVKALPSYEMERFENQAEENRASNEAAYAEWLKSYTPAQIKDANAARRRLATILDKHCSLLKDERLVKRPRSTFMWFSTERRNSGDFKHMTIGETALRIADEWKNLTESEKEPYEKKANEDRERYAREHEEAYGIPPKSSKAE